MLAPLCWTLVLVSEALSPRMEEQVLTGAQDLGRLPLAGKLLDGLMGLEPLDDRMLVQLVPELELLAEKGSLR